MSHISITYVDGRVSAGFIFILLIKETITKAGKQSNVLNLDAFLDLKIFIVELSLSITAGETRL